METRKSLFLRTLVALAIAAAPLTAYAAEQKSISADDSLALLLQGNQFYARGSLGNLVGNSRPKIRKQLAAGQHPYATVVVCSDSRVPRSPRPPPTKTVARSWRRSSRTPRLSRSS